MSEVAKQIRHKRFRVRLTEELKFLIETKMGNKYSLQMTNCSLTGCGATFEGEVPADEGLALGEMIVAAKISWTDHEYTLGRLVVRSSRKVQNKTELGFSLADSKMPIDGPMSKFLESAVSAEVNPYEFELSPEKFSIATFSRVSNDSRDLFSRCRQYGYYFREWENRARFLYRTVRTESKGVRVNLTKKRKNGRSDYIVMGSNDYLGMASHPKVCEAAKDAIDRYGFGSTGSPLSTGITDIHVELTDLIARTFRKERALLFNSGYTANVGAMAGVTSDRDLIVADVLSHASLQDGMQMTRATTRLFKHNSMDHLEKILKENRESHSGALLVTEGVFSMDGDVPPLDKFVELGRKYGARTFVDEAHSLGVVGERGLGSCDKYNVTDDVDIIMGTFSKVCGGIGGFLAASREVIDWYFWLARSHVFTVSVPPSTAAAMLASFKIFLENPQIVTQLQKNIRHFVTGLRELGCPLNPNHEAAVVPIVVGDEKKLEIMSQVLMDAGVFIVPIVFPAVSRTSCRFRTTVMANHSISDLDYVLSTLELAMKKADFSFTQDREMPKHTEGLSPAA